MEKSLRGLKKSVFLCRIMKIEKYEKNYICGNGPVSVVCLWRGQDL